MGEITTHIQAFAALSAAWAAAEAEIRRVPMDPAALGDALRGVSVAIRVAAATMVMVIHAVGAEAPTEDKDTSEGAPSGYALD